MQALTDQGLLGPRALAHVWRRAREHPAQGLPDDPLQALLSLGHSLQPLDGEGGAILHRNDDALAIVGPDPSPEDLRRHGARFGIDVSAASWRVFPQGAVFRSLVLDPGAPEGAALAAALLAPDGLLWEHRRPWVSRPDDLWEAHRTGALPGALIDPARVGVDHERSLAVRRDQGSYYTPAPLARAIARLALGPLLAQARTRDEVQALRVLDPAAGSGQILVAALDVLAEAWLERGPRAGLQRARRAVVGCLYGADLDADALEIARRRLELATVVEGESRSELAGLVHGDALLEVCVEDVSKPGGGKPRPYMESTPDGADMESTPDGANMESTPDGANMESTPDGANMESNPDGAWPHEGLMAALDAAAAELHGEPVRAVHWRARFPAVFARGGFDAVIGNPPYHRELDGKHLFTRVRRSRLGVRARSKGDLWQFFTHLALDLLRPGGQHAFVVPAYWLKATGAAPRALRERLRAEARWRGLIDLSRARVFPGVTARHAVFCVEKAGAATEAHTGHGPAALFRVQPDPARAGHEVPAVLFRVQPNADMDAVELAVLGEETHGVERLDVPAAAVYGRRGEVLLDLALDQAHRDLLARLQGGALPTGWVLSEGVTANPERLSARAMKRVLATAGVDLAARGLSANDPVFVVPHDWPDARQIPERERRHLLPYLHPRDVPRLRAEAKGDTPWLIYATRDTLPRAEDAPALIAHLARCREVMEQRRETQRGTREWFQLHWPRRPELFDGPRVLVPRMTRWPAASLACTPCASGESVYTLVPEDRAASPLLTALLNSLPFALGILLTTKARGKGIDIPRAALASCPWPGPGDLARARDEADHPLAQALAASASLVGHDVADHEGPWWEHGDPAVRAHGRALDEAVCAWLDVPYAACRDLAVRWLGQETAAQPAKLRVAEAQSA